MTKEQRHHETGMAIIMATILVAIVCCSCRTRRMAATSGSDAMGQAHRVAAYHAVDSILRLFSLSADSLVILLPGADEVPPATASMSPHQDINVMDGGKTAKAQVQHRPMAKGEKSQISNPKSHISNPKSQSHIQLYGLHLAGSAQTVEQRLSSLRHDTSHQSSSHQSKEVVKSPPLSKWAVALIILIIAAMAAIFIRRLRHK